MSKVNNYDDFIFEELFGMFKRKEKLPIKKSRIESCVEKILVFLKENQIEDWNDFESMKPFDREIINKLIDSEVENLEEMKEVRFEIRLNLSDRIQLKEMLREYEEGEQYEKCAKILKKMKNI